MLVRKAMEQGRSKAYRASLAIGETLAAPRSGNTDWQRDLSVSHDKIGDVLVAQGDRAGALDAYRAEPGDRRVAGRAAIRLTPRGSATSRSATRTSATCWWRRAMSPAHSRPTARFCPPRDARRADPANTEWQRDLSVSHNNIGDVLVAQGDVAGALAAYRASLAIGETLAARDPANTEWQRDLSVSHDKIGDVLRGARRWRRRTGGLPREPGDRRDAGRARSG